MSDKTSIDLTVSRNELAENIANNFTHDEIVRFVKRIDRLESDWDLTKQLYDYFAKEMKRFPEYQQEI